MLLAQGNSVAEAAAAVGIHRNTISNWRRAGSPEFREAWQTAQSEQADYWRDELQTLGATAVSALRTTLENPSIPALRLKAALSVIQTLSTHASGHPDANQASCALAEDAQFCPTAQADDETPADCSPKKPAQSCTSETAPEEDPHVLSNRS